MKFITINNLTFGYDTKKPLLNQLNLTIPTKSFSLLIGPTGCGKSTLMKILAQLYPKYGGQIINGQVDLAGHRQAMMFQNAGQQFTMATPREEIIFALENLQIGPEEYQVRLKEAVAFSQIERLLDQKISTMSGGEKQRVALAVLVAMDVDLLILDEPFASCDPETRKFLIAKLAELRNHGKTIIISDHVLSDYQEICDQIFAFKQERVVRLNDDEMEQLFATAEQTPDLHFSLPDKQSSVFTLKQTQIKQNRLLLNQEQLDIVKGKPTLITGANGIGKSSFFQALTQLITYEGSIKYEGREIRKIPARKYLTHVGQIFQSASDQFLTVTVADELQLSQQHNPHLRYSEDQVAELLKMLDLYDRQDQVVYSLSGGQKKKLQILLMLLSGQEVLLIDEPLSGLDHESVHQVIELMQRCQSELKQTMLIISHQIAELGQWCDYHLVFENQHLSYVER